MGSVGDPMLKFCVHVCISFLIVYVNYGGQILLTPQIICSQKKHERPLTLVAKVLGLENELGY